LVEARVEPFSPAYFDALDQRFGFKTTAQEQPVALAD
jgi:hypothetical protein